MTISQQMISQYLLFSIISYTTHAVLNYDGQYISGTSTSSASSEFLSLTDFARRLIAPSDINYQTPTGVLDYGENAFSEGALWAGNVWTQNTYGYGYSSTPFLNLAQTTTIQTSYLWWFDHQGDGGQFYGGLLYQTVCYVTMVLLQVVIICNVDQAEMLC